MIRSTATLALAYISQAAQLREIFAQLETDVVTA
jgi:hypothetical protein